jgi:type II secretory pathway predicted ATPase ExeA
LVTHLAEELGALTAPPRSLSDALRQLQGHLATSAVRQERPLLIIDDAHLIDAVATYEALGLLLNFATNGPPDLSLLFVGRAEVLLDLPSGLTDRLAARCLLGPMTEDESSRYLLGRLGAAGAKSPLFSQAALTALHSAAAGLPRRLNHLADMALLIAYARDLPIADELAVASAAREFNRDVAA